MSDANVPPPGWPLDAGPFHAGEIAVQERVGVAAKMAGVGRRVIRRFMPEQHRAFFPQLPFVLAGAVDDTGQPWATILAGTPGFLQSPAPELLEIAVAPAADDPLFAAWRAGRDVGLLGIELPTRRRNRVNGRLEASPGGLRLRVEQSFGNCPQYIQARTARRVDDAPGAVERRRSLTPADRAWIAAADTFFIASASVGETGPSGGADVSHRGGRPGFVRVDEDGILTVPDFVGNFLFNTLGNLMVEPRAGLLFIDWATGDLLQLAVTADVIWEGPEVRAFAGAQRLVRFRVVELLFRPGALPLRFSAPEWSPVLAGTGDWSEAGRAARAEALRDRWRPFRVAAIADESASIRSFWLEPEDGLGLSPYEPGQFLPVRVHVAGHERPPVRTYTVSNAPGGRALRISVKRGGEVSGWLHDRIAVGDRVEAMAPRGSFTFRSPAERPVVLVSAGVGLTPMIAFLDALLVNGDRSRHHAPIWFVHGARNGAEHGFAAFVRAKAAAHANLRVHVRYSHPGPGDRLGTTHDSEGRVDLDLLRALLPFDGYDFYLCGPAAFMQSLYDGLTALGVADDRIRLEAFGPGSVKRRRGPAAAPEAPVLPAEAPVEIAFARSGVAAVWEPGAETLLELAERAGLAPPYSCRTGLCGTCAVPLLAGRVAYPEPPEAELPAGRVLLCSALPASGPVRIDL